MLNDSKNKDYLDQIYFALGNISMKEGNEAEALRIFQEISYCSNLRIRIRKEDLILLLQLITLKNPII